MTTLSTNPQLELAFNYVQHTNKNIFLTGKAGTGKTTFLHRIKKESIKRTVVVAPTGVAAINAKGMTIHSLFQLPFGPFIPGQKRDAAQQRKFNKTKINLIRSLDLLIIDEISMVRSDILDAIDDVLRRYKNFYKPFGGVQLLMIGDLHQLPPVVKREEQHLLAPHYNTSYFFGSQALQRSDFITIQLTHIYRQADQTFIDLLNRVRNDHLDEEVLQLLNSRYIANFKPTEEEAYITLTSHNYSAQQINDEKLKELKTKQHQFEAEVEGDFREKNFPTEKTLLLKVGAQVLFIKNDPTYEKRYYNGKIGQVTKIEKDIVHVKCPDDPHTILVERQEWKNVKYSFDEGRKSVEEDVVGVFTQFPLKLAWAITIHKSQGLTFERAIIDANAAFAHGQVYVALSRCKSFEGIVLRSKIEFSSVKTDRVVKNYSEEAEKNAPTENDLLESRKQFQAEMILELFDFQPVTNTIDRLYRVFAENEIVMTEGAVQQLKDWVAEGEALVFSFAKSFQSQLMQYFSEKDLPEEQKALQDRLKKAGVYFEDKIGNVLLKTLREIPILTDNSSLRKVANDNFLELEKQLFVKKICFEKAKDTFSTITYLKAKADAEIDLAKYRRTLNAKKANIKIPKGIAHPELFKELVQWRDLLAEEYELNSYDVLPTKSIIELTHKLPTSKKTLLAISGIGKVKVKQFGADIISIVEEYCMEQGIQSNLMTAEIPKTKSSKPDTKKISFDLFKAGKTVSEIATLRKLTNSTIEGHLLYFMELGMVDIFSIIDQERVEEMTKYFMANKVEKFSEAKKDLNDKFSYGELKMVVAFMKKNGTEGGMSEL